MALSIVALTTGFPVMSRAIPQRCLESRAPDLPLLLNVYMERWFLSLESKRSYQEIQEGDLENTVRNSSINILMCGIPELLNPTGTLNTSSMSGHMAERYSRLVSGGRNASYLARHPYGP